LGDWEQLAERVEWARRFERIPYMGALLAQAEGVVESNSGDRDRADGLFRKALAEFDRLGVPLEAARTREWLAGVVGGDEARSLVHQALSTYESLRAKPHAERVRATLA